MATTVLVNNFWADKALYDDAERKYYENLAKLPKNTEENNVQEVQVTKSSKKSKNKKNKASAEAHAEVFVEVQPATPTGNGGKKEKKKNKNANKSAPANGTGGGPAPQQKSSLANEVAKAREHIKTSLESIGSVGLAGKPAPAQVESACRSGQCGASSLADALKAVQGQLQSLEKRVAALEIKCAGCAVPVKAAAAPPKPATPAKKDEDDDVDLFGSDSEEDEEAERLKEERVAAYAAKKSKKPALIAKSSIILDVKPWDDETDMNQLEKAVRAIEMEGLLWGASKFVPLAYGIRKLQITCVVEDEKVSVDLLTEQIEAVEDLVQSVDIAAFNKI